MTPGAEAIADEISQLRMALKDSERSAAYRLSRITKLTIERDAYRRELDKANPKKAAELDRQFKDGA